MSILPIATTWKDLEGKILNEMRQSEKDKHPRHHVVLLICGIRNRANRKQTNKNRIKQKTRLLSTENKWVVARWEVGEGMD